MSGEEYDGVGYFKGDEDRETEEKRNTKEEWLKMFDENRVKIKQNIEDRNDDKKETGKKERITDKAMED